MQWVSSSMSTGVKRCGLPQFNRSGIYLIQSGGWHVSHVVQLRQKRAARDQRRQHMTSDASASHLERGMDRERARRWCAVGAQLVGRVMKAQLATPTTNIQRFIQGVYVDSQSEVNASAGVLHEAMVGQKALSEWNDKGQGLNLDRKAASGQRCPLRLSL